MFHLVYASTATKPFSTEELLDLRQQSREKNSRLGITGMLLYKQGSFMQALEGDETTVRALYATICEDQRHHHVITLVAIAVPQRQFPDWSMGFKNLDDAEVISAPGYKSSPSLPFADDELSWKGSVALHLLATFMKEN